MYLTQGLHRALAQKPGEVATIFRARRHTFAELGERVARLAGALRRIGVQPGDRVGMLALNSDRYLEYYLAVYWAGGVVNPINTRWSAAEIAYALDDCDTRLLLLDDQFAPMAVELKDRAKSLCTMIHASDGPTPQGMLAYEELIAEMDPVEDALRNGSDLAGVFYTGGTTGFPKGVMLSHANLACNALGLLAEGVAAPGCVGLRAAPMFHLADGAFMNAMLASGATHVVIPSFTPLGVLEAVQEHGCTEAVLVPTMIQMTVDHPDVSKYRLDSMKTIVYGGSAISEAVIDRASRALPNVGLVQSYGMTECAPVITILQPRYHTPQGRRLGKAQSGGRASFCTEVRIVDAQDKPVPTGTVGEITTRGPGVMLGYWNKPEETARALRGGWMHTGDGGYVDGEGFLFIVDRLKDMIVTGGENVYCAEVENALAKHSAVAQCAVIGVPDDRWGERVHAVVVLKTGAQATAEELIQHCKGLIANYKCPRSAELRDALPLSGAGKVLKSKLREPYWEGRARRVA
ncbi:MAG TPA: long-chain fatty acid--CoA ligase [Burkholderiaceae bacterium]|nr:long-chain fatty acid--CoA ligase [Burkholderiaceae bacterium]